MPATLTVLLFAAARQAVGRARLERAVPPSGVPVAELMTALIREYPGLAPVAGASRLVKNGQYLKGTEGRVGPGDELAIHPPYSGG